MLVRCPPPANPARSSVHSPVRPFRAFAALSCRLRLSAACSVLQSAHLSDPVCLCLVLQGSFLSGIPCTQCRYGRITYFSAFLSCSMVSFAGVIPPGHASVYFGRRKNSKSNHKQLKCMATVKVKLRESSVGGKAGVIYYQLCHRRKSQQITTSMRLQPRQWDARRGCVITPLSGEAHALLSVQQRIDRDLCLLHTIIRDLEFRQEGYSLRDVVDRFRNSRRSTVLAYVETQAARLEANGKLGTARNYRRTLGSFSDFLGGRDIPFSLVDERLVGQYDDWLRRRALSAIPSRFICGYCARSIIKP